MHSAAEMSAGALRDLLRSIPALLFPDRCASCESLCGDAAYLPSGETAIRPAPLPPVGITFVTSSFAESTTVTDPSPSS